MPVLPEFLAELAQRREESQCDYIIEYKGQPVKRLQSAFDGAKRRANLGYPVRLYDIRHLFATVMLTGGADDAAVSRLLGHSAVSTTHRYYYHVMPGETRRAVALRPSLAWDIHGIHSD